jgi:hypothetical protein
MGNTYNNLIEKSLKKHGDNIKMDIEEIGCEIFTVFNLFRMGLKYRIL